jgi:hypothetical protein
VKRAADNWPDMKLAQALRVNRDEAVHLALMLLARREELDQLISGNAGLGTAESQRGAYDFIDRQLAALVPTLLVELEQARERADVLASGERHECD